MKLTVDAPFQEVETFINENISEDVMCNLKIYRMSTEGQLGQEALLSDLSLTATVIELMNDGAEIIIGGIAYDLLKYIYNLICVRFGKESVRVPD